MNILVVAAHPDDEILGCGGTMAKYVLEGAKVHVAILAEGLSARSKKRAPAKELKALRECARKANAAIGVKSLTVHDFPDNRMDSLDRLDVIKLVESLISAHEPDFIFTHHYGDANVDHRRISEAVMTAARPLPGRRLQGVLFFEVPSSTGWLGATAPGTFLPNWFEDISSTLDRKMNGLKEYESEMRPWPHARSHGAVEALARWRGASVGRAAAEAFELGRLIR